MHLRSGVPILPKFLLGLWNKIKRNSSAAAMEISEDDIVVFVVGPTGSGKSWFTHAATDCDLVKVSRDQHPSTDKVQAIRCELTDEAKKELPGVNNIVLVDTPSFLTGYRHPDPHKLFREWFSRTAYNPQYVGVIYMHRIETDPGLEPIHPHLQEFFDIPQIRNTRFPLPLRVVISYDKTSGTISEAKVERRKSDLRNHVVLLGQSRSRCHPSIHHKIFQGEPNVAWRAVEELFKSDHSTSLVH